MQVGTTIAGLYRLEADLGLGGTAHVFKAVELSTGAVRAIKALRVSTPSMRRRLRREAAAMAAIRHPNVLRVHEVGVHGEDEYIVMQLASGGSLQHRLRRGPVPPLAALDWTIEVLSALAAAHDAGVIHRDVKPANVLLDEGGRVLLGDFGIALVADQLSFTREGSAMGSVAFMSPEQRLDAHAVDARADLYSVGATLFSLLTRGNPIDLFMAPPDSPRLAALPAPCRDVVVRATRQSPEDRYPDARRMAAAVLAARAALVAQGGELEPAQEAMALGAALQWLGEDFAPWSEVPASSATAAPVADPRTGLTDREGLCRRARRALADGPRDGDELALILLAVSPDPDGWRPTDDEGVARAIAAGLRAGWPDAECLARLSAREYAVLTCAPEPPEIGLGTLRRALDARAPAKVAFRWARVCFDPRQDPSPAALLGRADLALHRARSEPQRASSSSQRA